MSVLIESGLWTTIWRRKKASTAITKDSFVVLDAGFVDAATTDTGAADKPCFGVYAGPSISSASATTDEIPVFVPIGPALVRADTTASIAATDEGKSRDLSTSLLVHATNTTYGVVTLVKFISTTQGLFAISKSVYANVA